MAWPELPGSLAPRRLWPLHPAAMRISLPTLARTSTQCHTRILGRMLGKGHTTFGSTTSSQLCETIVPSTVFTLSTQTPLPSTRPPRDPGLEAVHLRATRQETTSTLTRSPQRVSRNKRTTTRSSISSRETVAKHQTPTVREKSPRASRSPRPIPIPSPSPRRTLAQSLALRKGGLDLKDWIKDHTTTKISASETSTTTSSTKTKSNNRTIYVGVKDNQGR